MTGAFSSCIPVPIEHVFPFSFSSSSGRPSRIRYIFDDLSRSRCLWRAGHLEFAVRWSRPTPPARHPGDLPDPSAISQHSADTEGDTPPPARRRRPAAFPPPGGPQLHPGMAPAINALFRDLTVETNGRERFPMSTPADIHLAAETFARYRLTSLAVSRQTDAAARRMFLSDLRDLYRRSFPEMQLIMQLLSHFRL